MTGWPPLSPTVHASETVVPVLLFTIRSVGAEGRTAGTVAVDVAGMLVPSMFFAETRTR